MNERKCVYAFFLLEWLYHSKLEAGRLKVDEQIDRFDYFSFSFHKFSHSLLYLRPWMENLLMFLITRKLNVLIFMFIQKYTSHSHFFFFLFVVMFALSPNNLHLLFSSAIPSSLSTVYSACPFSFIC